VPTEGVEFYVRHGSDILVFPTHDGSTCIWAGRSHDHWDAYRKDVEHTYHEIIGLAPWLAERLRYSRQVSPFKGTSKLLNFYRQSFGKGWALVGDAAYHRDPLPGMGIGDAFLGRNSWPTHLPTGSPAAPRDLPRLWWPINQRFAIERCRSLNTR
jgi:2-polyprenyl-6-methoxyphenol hydroxylase-like FAD-dependent oxidoreductase